MLIEQSDRLAALKRWASDRVAHYTFRSFASETTPSDRPPSLLLSESPSGSVLIAKREYHLMFALNGAVTLSDLCLVFHDLALNNITPSLNNSVAGKTLTASENQDHRSYFLDSVPTIVYDAALQAGWAKAGDEETGPPALVFSFTGKPRFSHLQAHSCRLGRGVELYEILKAGIHYDPEGHYLNMCLTNRRSYVCEVDGQAVCASATHLNNSMAMIHTLPQFRRHGYARSLAAFQIDDCLAREGIAVAHVIEPNTPSRSMLASLGADEYPGLRICWRAVVPPQQL